MSKSEVYYYTVNSSNEITDMILYDAVSEGREYGVVTSVKETYTGSKDEDGEREVLYTYTYIINGTTYQGTTTNGVSTGPAVFRMQDGERVYSMSLTSKTLNSVDYLTAYSSGTKYSVSENVQCYIKTGTTYTKANVSSMDADKYYLTGYIFDGAVRVIIAKAK